MREGREGGREGGKEGRKGGREREGREGEKGAGRGEGGKDKEGEKGAGTREREMEGEGGRGKEEERNELLLHACNYRHMYPNSHYLLQCPQVYDVISAHYSYTALLFMCHMCHLHVHNTHQ